MFLYLVSLVTMIGVQWHGKAEVHGLNPDRHESPVLQRTAQRITL